MGDMYIFSKMAYSYFRLKSQVSLTHLNMIKVETHLTSTWKILQLTIVERES